MCDLLRQTKYTIDSLEEELRLTRIGRDSCNKFLFYKEEECAALQKKLSAAEAKVEKVRKCVDILDSHFPDTPAYRELKQILK